MGHDRMCFNFGRRRRVTSRDYEKDNPTGDLQVATNRARADSLRRARVPAVLALVPRCRRTAQRTRRWSANSGSRTVQGLRGWDGRQQIGALRPFDEGRPATKKRTLVSSP